MRTSQPAIFILAFIPAVAVILGIAFWHTEIPRAAAAETPQFSVSVSPEIAYAGDLVTATALPENFTTTGTIFNWYRNGALVPEASGPGKSIYSFVTDPSNPEVVEIKVIVNVNPDFALGEQSTVVYAIPNPSDPSGVIGDIQASFSLEASSENPSPGETVTISVSSFAFDKYQASYTWYIDGVLDRAASGRGRFSIAVPAGKDGDIKTVRVEVTTPEGIVRAQGVAIRTFQIPFYWWANTDTPYWYKGKALPTINSTVTVFALPTVRESNTLSYQWKFNGSVASQASGAGRQTYSFPLALPVEERVSVTARNTTGSINKTATIGIGPYEPQVGIYASKPLSGITSAKELSEFSAPAGEQYDFVAAPFFFTKMQRERLQFEWSFNGTLITGDFSKPWLFSVTSNRGQSTRDRLDVLVSDPQRGGKKAYSSITITLQ